MKNQLIVTSILFALSAGMPAFASDDDEDCNVPISQWQSREAARDWAESQGWDVRRIKTDDDCYEIKGYDQSGREIEVKIDPGTLAIVKFEYEDDYDDDDNRKKNKTRGNDTRSTGPITPPDNGLFAPGSAPKVIVK